MIKEKTVKPATAPATLFESKTRFVFINIVMPLLAAVSLYDIVMCLLKSKSTSYLTFFLLLIHCFICIASCLLVRDSAKSSFYIITAYCCYFILVLCIPLVTGIVSQSVYTQYFYSFAAITGMSRLISITLSVGAWLTTIMRVIFALLSFAFFSFFIRETIKLQPLFNGESKAAKTE